MYAHIFFSLTTGLPPPEDKIIDISAYPLPQSINAAAVLTYIGGGAARCRQRLYNTTSCLLRRSIYIIILYIYRIFKRGLKLAFFT